jgi:hypothetical protein
MAIVGEYSFWANTGGSQSFEYNMPADRILAKVCLTYAQTLAGFPDFGSSFGVFITKIKRKKPDGQIEEVVLQPTNTVYDDNMTHITYYIVNDHVAVANPPLVWVLVTLEYWG